MLVALWRPDELLPTCTFSDLMPKFKTTASRNTMEEWPNEKKKPTLKGRWPSLTSFLVVLSIAAMWSASKAWRMPRV